MPRAPRPQLLGRIWASDSERDPEVWLEIAERAAACADHQESDPHGRGVDHEMVNMYRARARNALRRAEELLSEAKRSRRAGAAGD